MNEFSVYVGLDVHKDSIAVAVVVVGHGETANTLSNNGCGAVWFQCQHRLTA